MTCSIDGSLEMNVVIPGNATARIRVPKAGTGSVVMEGGRIVWQNGKYLDGTDGISGGWEDDDYISFSVGSGSYRFKVS